MDDYVRVHRAPLSWALAAIGPMDLGLRTRGNGVYRVAAGPASVFLPSSHGRSQPGQSSSSP